MDYRLVSRRVMAVGAATHRRWRSDADGSGVSQR
jgi:hypothetical protein